MNMSYYLLNSLVEKAKERLRIANISSNCDLNGIKIPFYMSFSHTLEHETLFMRDYSIRTDFHYMFTEKSNDSLDDWMQWLCKTAGDLIKPDFEHYLSIFVLFLLSDTVKDFRPGNYYASKRIWFGLKGSLDCAIVTVDKNLNVFYPPEAKPYIKFLF